jgi:uridine kinase
LAGERDPFDTICDHVLGLRLSHPIRIGVDGITASGKSTFARNLAERLRASNRPLIQTTLDGFHNPRSHRYRQGRGSAQGYYFDAYNYQAVVEHLLAPLGPLGNRRYKTCVFDLENDRPVDLEAEVAASDSILIVDGSFALRTELREHWDVGVYLQASFAVAEERAVQRDTPLFGSSDEARQVTRERYHGAHKIHLEEACPLQVADFVIRNDAPTGPIIVRA